MARHTLGRETAEQQKARDAYIASLQAAMEVEGRKELMNHKLTIIKNAGVFGAMGLEEKMRPEFAQRFAALRQDLQAPDVNVRAAVRHRFTTAGGNLEQWMVPLLKPAIENVLRQVPPERFPNLVGHATPKEKPVPTVVAAPRQEETERPAPQMSAPHAHQPMAAADLDPFSAPMAPASSVQAKPEAGKPVAAAPQPATAPPNPPASHAQAQAAKTPPTAHGTSNAKSQHASAKEQLAPAYNDLCRGQLINKDASDEAVKAVKGVVWDHSDKSTRKALGTREQFTGDARWTHAAIDALEKVQEKHKIKPDGRFGARTYTALTGGGEPSKELQAAFKEQFAREAARAVALQGGKSLSGGQHVSAPDTSVVAHRAKTTGTELPHRG